VQPSDEDLLVDGSSEAFATFYRRHARDVLRYFARRVGDPEVAADLTAETFAAAVVARARFRPDRGPAAPWLYGIAGHKLADYRRRGKLEDRARQQLGMAHVEVTAEDVVYIEALGNEIAAEILSVLPADQRRAVAARVLADASYDDLARDERITKAAIRRRVGRGPRALRAAIQERQ
jgi:RNA polymerase sigma factor (sigma-70 family)